MQRPLRFQLIQGYEAIAEMWYEAASGIHAIGNGRILPPEPPPQPVGDSVVARGRSTAIRRVPPSDTNAGYSLHLTARLKTVVRSGFASTRVNGHTPPAQLASAIALPPAPQTPPDGARWQLQRSKRVNQQHRE